MKTLSLLCLSLLILSACANDDAVNLESLGSTGGFEDVEIPDDFTSPEEDAANNEPTAPQPDTPEESPAPAPSEPEEDEILPPPIEVNLKNTFHLDPGSFRLAHNSARRWNGCSHERQTRGGYNSDTQCGRAFFHQLLADNLNEVFFVCLSDAARAGGYPQPVRAFIRHLGSYNDRNARNSGRLSNHAYARAWDIVNFNLIDAQGRNHRISTHINHYSGAQARFYDEFRDCWQDSMPSSCRPGHAEFRGSIGHRASKLGGNTLHNDHIHLSYPLCAGG